MTDDREIKAGLADLAARQERRRPWVRPTVKIATLKSAEEGSEPINPEGPFGEGS